MISPQNAAELVLSYHCEDSQYAAALVLDAISAAGYVVLNKSELIKLVLDCQKVGA